MERSEEQVLFSEQFDGKLDSGWTWLRENPGRWRFSERGLEIAVEPGLAGTVRNALVRPAPDRSSGPYAVEVTIFNHTVPTQPYEQAGITWYQDGQPVFKEVKELVDGEVVIIPGRNPMPTAGVRLRLVVSADSWEAQFRGEGASEFENGRQWRTSAGRRGAGQHPMLQRAAGGGALDSLRGLSDRANLTSDWLTVAVQTVSDDSQFGFSHPHHTQQTDHSRVEIDYGRENGSPGR